MRIKEIFQKLSKDKKLRSRAPAILITTLLLLFIAPTMSFATDPFEPNDTMADAYRIYAGPKVSYISSSTDIDFFKVWIWENLEFRATLTVPAYKDYDLQLLNSVGTFLVGSYNGPGQSELITYTPSSDMWVFIKVYGFNGSYDTTNTYTVGAGWTSPKEVTARITFDYVQQSGTWYARPWATTENATQLAAPQATDTYAIPMVNRGAPYGYGNKDMGSHIASKLSTNGGYSTSRFYDYWWPVESRTVMYCPNVIYSSGIRDAQSNMDALRFSGETDTSRRGWVGVDCSGLVQRAAWLAGYRLTDDTEQELGRIGSLNSKGDINMNTWGGEVAASWFATTTYAQDVTGWIRTNGEDAINILPGMGSILRSDIVVYRASPTNGVSHVAAVSVPGTTQLDTHVRHAVWRDREVDLVTGTNYWRRATRTLIMVLENGGEFKIRRLTTIR